MKLYQRYYKIPVKILPSNIKKCKYNSQRFGGYFNYYPEEVPLSIRCMETPKMCSVSEALLEVILQQPLTQQIIQSESHSTEISDWTLSFHPDLKVIKLQRVKK